MTGVSKFDWGVVVRPTKECFENTGMLIKSDDYAISLGLNKNGLLVLVRHGQKSAQVWAPNYWEVLKEI